MYKVIKIGRANLFWLKWLYKIITGEKMEKWGYFGVMGH